jgi:methylmalonyl-CoA/ethylmalonyl-CoA epimerase
MTTNKVSFSRNNSRVKANELKRLSPTGKAFCITQNAMQKIEHLGIAVKSLIDADGLFSRLLGSAPYKHEMVESEGVTTSFFQVGESKIELLEATQPDSPIAKFIEKKGEGIHHIAFAVDDIRAEMRRLQAEGFQLLSDEPKMGADNKWVCFLHPKSTNGVLIELCQERS